jgi:hypothetical protein
MSKAKQTPTITLPAPTQVMAKMYLTGAIMVPLHVAHQIQALLAENAVGFDYTYRAGKDNVDYIITYSVPNVEVVKKRKIYDATMLTYTQIQEWTSAVRECDEDGTIMEPADFAALTA